MMKRLCQRRSDARRRLIGQRDEMSADNTGGRDKSRVSGGRMDGWTKTAKHLPLSLGVQAALVVQVLPTQEEFDMLQLRVPELTEAVHSLATQSTIKEKKKKKQKRGILPSTRCDSTVSHLQ